MSTIRAVFCLLFFFSTVAMSKGILHYPLPAQHAACYKAYKNTVRPARLAGLVSSMKGLCHDQGGVRVMHTALPPIVVLACMEKNKRKPLYICRYKRSFYNL